MTGPAAVTPGIPARTLLEAVLDAAARCGARTLIVQDFQGAALSYGRLLQASYALGRRFAALTRELENVGVLLPNTGVALAVVLGLQAWRRVPAMLNYSSGPEPLRNACRLAQVRWVVTSRRFIAAAKLEAHVAALDGVQVLYLEELRAQISLLERARAWWAAARGRRAPGAAADDPAFVLFTSGSEDSPKGVVLSHRAVLTNIAQMSTVFPFAREDTFLSVLPIYHSYGLTACTLMPLVSGTQVCFYTNPLHYHLIPEIVRTHGCRVLFGTSTFLGHYARHAQPADFASVRYVISGGEQLDPEVASAWHARFGITIYEGYGCTECAPVIALNTPTAHRAGSVGRLLPGLQHRLRAVAGIAEGGELHVRGDNVMLGYYLSERPGVLRPPASLEGEGWHNTGDLVTVNGEGFLHFHGRLKRFAKIAGEMIALDLLENVARQASPEHQHAAVAELISGGESTLLFTTDPTLTRPQLARAARAMGNGDLAVARRIEYTDTLPRLGSGKADYVALARRQAAARGA